VNFTARQVEAQQLLAGLAKHILLYGGSRSGKTFLIVRAIVMRALKAPGSRHVMLRFRFNHIKTSIVADTFPKVMAVCFPGTDWHLDKTDWYVRFKNGAEIWFAGLDDKDRTEKILGKEYVTIYFNECSQITLDSRDTALTRLAQAVMQLVEGMEPTPLKPRVYYDCNPPSKGHWVYKVFFLKVDPTSRLKYSDPDNYVAMQMNPVDNQENLAPDYLDTLKAMPARKRKRFLDGAFADENPNALWTEETIDRWRTVGVVPEWQRIVVAVDPSGSGDENNESNDPIGIVVCALARDGIGYVIEDCTMKAGPLAWGRVATGAYDRHEADCIVGEINFGGAMVGHVILTARPRTPYKTVTASRGKHVRAEPVAALFESGKIRMFGEFRDLESEMLSFSTLGYLGEGSPNRADAMIWGFSELFPSLVKPPRNPKPQRTAEM
jgi:phage terminase large subunit-like protein